MKTTDALRCVEEALTAGVPTAREGEARELQELALALQAESPVAQPEFARRLDEHVATGFGRKSRPLARFSAAARARPVFVGGAVASLLIVLAVAGASVTRLLDGRDGSHTDAAGKAAALPSDLAEAGRPRRVERTAELTLATPADRIDHVSGEILAVTDRHRGVVLDSAVTSGPGSARGGSFELRVPTRELEATLRDLSDLADVRSRSRSDHDVTGTYNAAADRLETVVVERRSLLRRLSHAASTGEADRMRGKLDRLGIEISRLHSALEGLRKRTDFTHVHVSLLEGRKHPAGGVLGSLRGSWRTLLSASAIALRATAAVLPFAVLMGVAWAAGGAFRRRRREAVLY